MIDSLFSYLRFAAKFWVYALLILGPTFGSLALTAWIWGDPWDIFVALFWLAIGFPYLFAAGYTR